MMSRSSNKKLFFVVSRMDRGGAQKVFLNIINYIINKTNFTVYLILFKSNLNDAYLQQLSNKCNLLVLNTSAKFGWFKLIKIIKYHKPKVIFSTLNYINISVALATVISRVKTTLILREARPLSQTSKITIAFQKLVYWRADYFWAITPIIGKELRNIFNIKNSKIILAPNPLNFIKFNSAKDKFKVGNPIKILFVGRLIPLKNIHLLIESISLISNKNWSLKIVGAGELENDLKKIVKEKNLLHKIEFTGFDKNPYKYMEDSDIFCLPSKFEGFPNVLTEALYFGNVCLANDTIGGGVKYIKSLISTVEIVDFKNFLTQ